MGLLLMTFRDLCQRYQTPLTDALLVVSIFAGIFAKKKKTKTAETSYEIPQSRGANRLFVVEPNRLWRKLTAGLE